MTQILWATPAAEHLPTKLLLDARDELGLLSYPLFEEKNHLGACAVRSRLERVAERRRSPDVDVEWLPALAMNDTR